MNKSDLRAKLQLKGSQKIKESIKSQEMRTITQKTTPFRIKNRGESESRSKLKINCPLFEWNGLNDSDIDENILQDPYRKKLMVWLLPQMKNNKWNAKMKKNLKKALQNKLISKQDLIDLMSKKNGNRANSLIPHHEESGLRYGPDMDETDTYKDRIDNCKIILIKNLGYKSKLKIMTLKEEMKVIKSRPGNDRNVGNSNLFSRSSKSTLKNLAEEFIDNSELNNGKFLFKLVLKIRYKCIFI